LVRGAPTPNLNWSGVREPPTNIVILEKRIALDEKVEELIRNRMLLTTDNGKTVSASKLGALCALKGISVQTGLYLKKKLEAPLDFDPFSWFYDVLDTKDGEEIYINVFPFEEESRMYEEALAERYNHNQTTNEKIRGLLERKIGFSHKETQLVKLSLLLTDWITPQSTLDLENKYLCRSGQIDQIGKKASWLLGAASGIAKVLNLNHKFPPPLTGGGKGEGDIVRFLKKLSQEVNFGVDQRGLSLAKLRVPGLGRDYVWNLVQNDFHSKKKIKEAKLTDLEKFIPIRVAERLKERIQDSPPEADPPPAEKFNIQDSTFAVKKDGFQRGKRSGLDLVIDGSGVKDKFLVLVNGTRVNLPAKSFKYLVKLTWALFSAKGESAAGGQNEGGWIHKNDFEPGENQTRYLHRLKNQIKPYLDSDQILFENNRLGSYRLTIPRQRIKLNPDALLKNPDTEIKKMVEEMVKG
jgi:hypothetical protein